MASVYIKDLQNPAANRDLIQFQDIDQTAVRGKRSVDDLLEILRELIPSEITPKDVREVTSGFIVEYYRDV